MDYVRLVVLYIIKDGMDYGVDWQSYITDHIGWCGLCRLVELQIIKDVMDYVKLVELKNR